MGWHNTHPPREEDEFEKPSDGMPEDLFKWLTGEEIEKTAEKLGNFLKEDYGKEIYHIFPCFVWHGGILAASCEVGGVRAKAVFESEFLNAAMSDAFIPFSLLYELGSEFRSLKVFCSL